MPIDVPANTIGLLRVQISDGTGGWLTDQLAANGIAYQIEDVPTLTTWHGDAYLVRYVGRSTGAPVAVLVVPSWGAIDDPGETYYTFDVAALPDDPDWVALHAAAERIGRSA